MIEVYAPASIGNIGVGFDTLGMSVEPIDGSVLGDSINIEASDSFAIKCEGRFYDQLPIILEQNIIFQCWKRFNEILGKNQPLSFRLRKNVPVSSGLGSSACSIVSALVAMNCYYGYPLNNDQLLIIMGEMEGKISGSIHFDNVASCFLGGMRLVISDEYANINQIIPSFNHWIWILAYPGIRISTKSSRSVLPKQYSRKDCINHSRYLSGFIHACHTHQEDLAIKCIQDIVAEPYRSKLLPVDLSYVRCSIIELGAVSCGISGAGPTLFALCNTKSVVKNVSDWLSSFYLKGRASGFIKVCSLNNVGVRVVME